MADKKQETPYNSKCCVCKTNDQLVFMGTDNLCRRCYLLTCRMQGPDMSWPADKQLDGSPLSMSMPLADLSFSWFKLDPAIKGYKDGCLLHWPRLTSIKGVPDIPNAVEKSSPITIQPRPTTPFDQGQHGSAPV